jgi:hypothetical protein
MSLICNIPEDLVNTLLRFWVNAEDLGRLDSAMCNRSRRATFLSLVTSERFAIGDSDIWQWDGAFIDRFAQWLMQRSIAVAELTVTKSFIENESARQTYLIRHGTHFRKVTVRWDIKVNNNYMHILEELIYG